MNAASVHGGGDVFARISLKFGRRGYGGPYAPTVVGMDTDSGRDWSIEPSEDMTPFFSSASQRDP